MKNACCVLLFILSSLIAAPSFAAGHADAANCKDHPLLTRLPDYWIESCKLKQFDAYDFMVGKGKPEHVEGRFTNIRYQPPANLTEKPSTLQVLRNVENAIKKVGGTLVAADSSKETLKLTKDGKELWIEVWADYTGKYILTIVEKEAMTQQLSANADVFADGLRTTGHIAVDGILFDTGKSTLKPESEQAIAEVAKLLKANPGLNIYVVGHTDNVGALAGNMQLAQGRAQAVVDALTQTHGIAATRLKAFGAGPYAPVASNDSEEGRARNRRVELVKQ
jgi:outer membrane protein OmpA-like peptidoglycan-associated protein